MGTGDTSVLMMSTPRPTRASRLQMAVAGPAWGAGEEHSPGRLTTAQQAALPTRGSDSTVRHGFSLFLQDRLGGNLDPGSTLTGVGLLRGGTCQEVFGEGVLPTGRCCQTGPALLLWLQLHLRVS